MSQRRLLKRRTGTEKPASLNLVSLMDIFTILVFFLMVNASEVEILETSTAIKLPDSISEASPEDRISIEVSHDALLLQGKVIAQVPEILANQEPVIDVLVSQLHLAAQDIATQDIAAQNLEEQTQRTLQVPFQGKVTIMGDKALPYDLLKKVMRSCQTANFTSIALAVNQTSEEAAS